MYKSIQITLPISPRFCVLLNREGITGYMQVPSEVVQRVNRITCLHADAEVVVRANHFDPKWIEQTPEPEDSWEKTHAKEIEEASAAVQRKRGELAKLYCRGGCAHCLQVGRRKATSGRVSVGRGSVIVDTMLPLALEGLI